MSRKKQRFPSYTTIVGEGTEVAGGIRFTGALHVEGKVIGDIKGASQDGCALTLGRRGTIEGNLDVAYVVLDGTVVGDVRASYRAELASGARIDGTLYYNLLEMAEGAEVNGNLLHIKEKEARPLTYQHALDKQSDAALDPIESPSDTYANEGSEPGKAP